MQPQLASTPWRPWEAIPVAVAAFAASLIVGILLTTLAGGGGSTPIITLLVLQAALALFCIVWVGVRYRERPAALGLRSTRAGRDVVVGAWSGAALFAAVLFGLLPGVLVVWRLVTGGLPEPIDQAIFPADPVAIELALAFLAAVVGAPLSEEIFFRGFVFASLRARLGFLPAAAISAALFAVVHGQVLLIILMFFVGLAFAWLYERRGSLLAPLAAHAAFNVVGYTLIVMERA